MQGHLGKDGVTVDQIADDLQQLVDTLLRRLEGDMFTTTQFIEILQSVPEGQSAYEAAWHRWGEQERASKMVIHGQVIPLTLRRSNLVTWEGYAHGEEDDYAVPAWWKLTASTE